MTAESTPLIIDKIVRETDRAKTIFVKHKDGSPVAYKPGQFMHFGFRQLNAIAYRSYSLSTIPEEGAAFTVKEMENGDVSRSLQQYKEGDTLNLINVGGKFVLPQNMEAIQQVFLFAAGSGITPVFAILKQILKHHPGISVYLAYSNSTPAATIFYEAIKALAEDYPERLQVNFIFSSNKNLLKARLSGFWLQEIVQEHRKAAWENILAYTCGPVEYMDNIKITLFTCGIRSEHFYMEYFETISDGLLLPPPDQELHRVTIKLLGQEHHLEVQYPDTILSAGVNAGLKLPYSCRSGQCGSCTARLVSGEVWLQYNEVLTPDDLRNGLTLTCMGCPVNGDVTLQYD
ncbi:MAG: hypothetical protein BGO31_13540 [Bacteroidetes bacterium 43-16]|mgnify:CR=1 FL=1|nr:MAG: hypothetical protein BGO31_13540 [Bacteroidetes bacterium 43-16]